MRCSATLTLIISFASQASADCLPSVADGLRRLGCNDYQIQRKCKSPNQAELAAKVQSESLTIKGRSPRQGILAYNGDEERVAPLRITTPAEGSDYFISLLDSNDHAVVMTMFIAGGQTYETKVPLGSFVMRYSTGSGWLGDKLLFGICHTQHFEAGSVLEFSENDDGVSGHAVELIKQVGGNLTTKSLDDDDN